MDDLLIVGLSADDQALLQKVYDWARPQFADQQTASGERLIDHALGTSRVLAEMHADAATRAAALLIVLPDLNQAKQIDSVIENFGDCSKIPMWGRV